MRVRTLPLVLLIIVSVLTFSTTFTGSIAGDASGGSDIELAKEIAQVEVA